MKQVIILRKDLNMRKGKMIAQGSHASLKAYLLSSNTQDAKQWIEDGMKKICVSCDSEEELRSLHAEAIEAKLPCAIILDAGHTEFKKPTLTSVAIGPADDAEIDKITSELKLL